ncbi:MAG: SDR family oxidoreductase [Actinobacteria bacterium]|nr:SDR family oxidoreductase [Actinomycetota bacterium]
MKRFPGAHEGRVAVVTGGAAGLGRAYAERLARDGAKVVVADLEEGDQVVAAIEADGGEALAVTCDVTSEAAIAELRERTDERFGGCDILVNNAGIFPNVPWEEVDYALWSRVLAVNLDSMFLTCKAFSAAMRERGFGRIVNISSNTFDLVIPGFVHYVASKAGVIGLTRALATELGEDEITVNCILPGLTRTAHIEEMWAGSPTLDHVVEGQAIKRPGMPADLEAVVSFLASEDARWISGQAIPVDGGQARH